MMTRWFNTENGEKPSRAGLYMALVEIPSFGGTHLAEFWVHFDGREFGAIGHTQDAALRKMVSKVRRPIVWRGLNERA
jgi:hypothetical protein